MVRAADTDLTLPVGFSKPDQFGLAWEPNLINWQKYPIPSNKWLSVHLLPRSKCRQLQAIINRICRAGRSYINNRQEAKSLAKLQAWLPTGPSKYPLSD